MKAWILATALSVVAIFAPIKSILLTVGVLIFADLILGMLCARKRTEPISSAALRRTVSKLFIYQATICLGFLCEFYLTGSLLPISKLVAGAIGLVEFKSILESADELNGGSVFKALIARLGSSNDSLK